MFFIVVLSLSAVLAHAQTYTSIVVFGDSLSDTGNVAHLTELKYGVRIPGPLADYTDGRFTDGTNTVPAAHNYNGVWVEQLAAMLPGKPAITDSLDGGTNYAYGYARTGAGTAPLTFGSSNQLLVIVDNIGQQITDYLATKPKITDKTLFVVWGGAIDLLNATSTKDVVIAALNQTGNVERLIEAGATRFLVLNLPPLGATPRLNGSPGTSIPATQASIWFNSILGEGMGLLRDYNRSKHVQIHELNVFTLFNKVLDSPSAYALANVTDISQGNYTVDPDTYLFWDDLHPTTRGHDILAVAAAKLISRHECDGSAEFTCRDTAVVDGSGK